MLSLSCYESRLAGLNRLHPEMPGPAITMVRFVIFLQRRLEDHLAKTLEQHGLSHSAWSLLMMIYSDPRQTINPSTASEALRQSRPHMTRMSDELAARGWVERVVDESDRRAVEIRLTTAGAAAMQEILPLMWREYEQLVSAFSADETAALSGMLRRWLIDLEDPPQQAQIATAPEQESP